MHRWTLATCGTLATLVTACAPSQEAANPRVDPLGDSAPEAELLPDPHGRTVEMAATPAAVPETRIVTQSREESPTPENPSHSSFLQAGFSSYGSHHSSQPLSATLPSRHLNTLSSRNLNAGTNRYPTDLRSLPNPQSVQPAVIITSAATAAQAQIAQSQTPQGAGQQAYLLPPPPVVTPTDSALSPVRAYTTTQVATLPVPIQTVPIQAVPIQALPTPTDVPAQRSTPDQPSDPTAETDTAAAATALLQRLRHQHSPAHNPGAAPTATRVARVPLPLPQEASPHVAERDRSSEEREYAGVVAINPAQAHPPRPAELDALPSLPTPVALISSVPDPQPSPYGYLVHFSNDWRIRRHSDGDFSLSEPCAVLNSVPVVLNQRLTESSNALVCEGGTRVLAQRMPEAATAGMPMPGRVESPTRNRPEIGVE